MTKKESVQSDPSAEGWEAAGINRRESSGGDFILSRSAPPKARDRPSYSSSGRSFFPKPKLAAVPSRAVLVATILTLAPVARVRSLTHQRARHSLACIHTYIRTHAAPSKRPAGCTSSSGNDSSARTDSRTHTPRRRSLALPPPTLCTWTWSWNGVREKGWQLGRFEDLPTISFVLIFEDAFSSPRLRTCRSPWEV